MHLGSGRIRILAVADEVDDNLYAADLKKLQVDLVVACGDLPFDYLETLVTMASVPLVYVPGNHDPDLRRGSYAVSPEDIVKLKGAENTVTGLAAGCFLCSLKGAQTQFRHAAAS